MEEITEITREGITCLHARLTVYEFLLEILYGQKWAPAALTKPSKQETKSWTSFGAVLTIRRAFLRNTMPMRFRLK